MVSPGTVECPRSLALASYLADTMDEEERASFEAHLGVCDECLARLVGVGRLRDEPSPERESLRLDRAWTRVEQALRHMAAREGAQPPDSREPARVIRLRATTRAPLRRQDPRALAAATEQAPPLSVITLAAEGEAIIGKLGRAEANDDLVLYLITEHMETLSGSRVTARDEESGNLSEGTPDDYGVVTLPHTASWDPSKLVVEIRQADSREG